LRSVPRSRVRTLTAQLSLNLTIKPWKPYESKSHRSAVTILTLIDGFLWLSDQSPMASRAIVFPVLMNANQWLDGQATGSVHRTGEPIAKVEPQRVLERVACALSNLVEPLTLLTKSNFSINWFTVNRWTNDRRSTNLVNG